ncbi:MAG: GPP34 family phosphoprotein [Anaerolineales bacterium]
MTNLSISEELLILCISNDKGSITNSAKSVLRYGLTAALLADLALTSKIRLDDDRLFLSDLIPTGEALFDEMMTALSDEKKPRKLKHWVDNLGHKHNIKSIAKQLVKRNVICIEQKRYLWVIPYELYPQQDASAKYWVKQRLRSIVLAGEKAESADIVLLSLLKACRLLSLVFTRDEYKAAEKQVDELTKGEVFGEAVSKVLADNELVTVVGVMS